MEKLSGMPLQEIKVISGAKVRERPQFMAAADMKTFFHHRGKSIWSIESGGGLSANPSIDHAAAISTLHSHRFFFSLAEWLREINARSHPKSERVFGLVFVADGLETAFKRNSWCRRSWASSSLRSHPLKCKFTLGNKNTFERCGLRESKLDYSNIVA